MTTKVTLTPLRKYTFNEIGEFIFQSSWKDNKDVGINIHLVKIMMNSFDAEWDSETDRFTVIVVQGMLKLSFKGDEIRDMYKSIPIF